MIVIFQFLLSAHKISDDLFNASQSTQKILVENVTLCHISMLFCCKFVKLSRSNPKFNHTILVP